MNEVDENVVSWELAEEMLDTIDYLKFKLQIWEDQATYAEKKRVNRAMQMFYKRGKRVPELEEVQ